MMQPSHPRKRDDLGKGGKETSLESRTKALPMTPSEQFEKLGDVLLKYAGWHVTMWFYTVSHSELVLQLRHPEVYRVKFLVLSGCRDICVPAEGVLDAIETERRDELSCEVKLFEGFRVHAETWRLVDEYKILTQ